MTSCVRHMPLVDVKALQLVASLVHALGCLLLLGHAQWRSSLASLLLLLLLPLLLLAVTHAQHSAPQNLLLFLTGSGFPGFGSDPDPRIGSDPSQSESLFFGDDILPLTFAKEVKISHQKCRVEDQ